MDAEIYPWSDSSLISVYQKLFITQATLCELYFQLEEIGDNILIVTPISAYIRSRKSSVASAKTGTLPIDSEEHLSPNIGFFGEPENFFNVTEEKVQSLLEGFWSQYHDSIDIEPSLQILNLDKTATWKAIRQRYRELASQHHPDKGGESSMFMQIRNAYECLKRQHS